MNLTTRSFLNSATAIIGFAARMATSFFVQPILVSILGDRAFGTWQICQRLMDQMSTGEGRSMQALKFTLAHKLGDPDPIPKRTDLGSAIQIGLLFVPLQIAIASVIIYFAPVFFEGGEDLIPMVRLTLVILVGNLLLAGVMNLADAILVGENLNYKAVWVRTALLVLRGIFLVVAAYLGYGVPGLAVAIVTFTVTSGVALFLLVRRFVAWLGVLWPTRAQLKKFFGFSGWILIWTLVNRMLLTGDVIILGAVASPEVVTVYVLTFYLMQTGASALALGVGGSMPSIGMIVGEGRVSAARGIRGEIMRMVWVLITTMGSVVLLWNEEFVGLWVGEEKFAGTLTNLLIVILVGQQIFFRSDGQILDTTLNIRLKVAWGSFAAALAVTSGVLLGREYGIPGLLCGLIAGGLVLTIAFPILSMRNLQGDPLRQFLGVIRPGLASAAIFYACWGLQPLLNAGGWIALFLYVGLTVLVVVPAALLLGLTGPQRRQVVTRLRSALSRR